MKFLVPNYSCHQNPSLGGYRSQIPVLLPQQNLLNPSLPPNKITGYATAWLQYTVETFWHWCQNVKQNVTVNGTSNGSFLLY